MKRRWLIASLGSAALTFPRFATAQLPVARVAVLAGNPSLPQLSVSPFWRAFVEALRERGWDERRNIVFHLRAGEGIEERYQQLAAELVTITDRIAACSDPTDDKFLELAVNGHADLIVSGDGDLLALNPFRDIPIVTPAAFVQGVVR